MKQRFYVSSVVMVLFAAIILAGCSTKEEAAPASTTAGSETKAPAATVKTADAPKAADIHQKATEAAANLKSFSGKLNYAQTLTQGSDKMDVKTDIEMQLIKGPESVFHQKKTLVMNAGADSQNIPLEAYKTNAGAYMYNADSKTWAQLPATAIEDYLSGDALNVAKEIEKLKPYLADVKAEDKNDTYELKLTNTGDKLKDFVTNEFKNDPGLLKDMNLADELDSTKIKKLETVYVLDKKTYYVKSVTLSADLELVMDGEKAGFTITSTLNYSDHDALTEIKIPDDVLKSAGQ